MTRDELRTILTGVELTDAQMKAVLDANSADITKALNRAAAFALANNDTLSVR